MLAIVFTDRQDAPSRSASQKKGIRPPIPLAGGMMKSRFWLMAVACWFATAIIFGSHFASGDDAIELVPDARQSRPEEIGKVAVIEVRGEINFELTRYFKNRFQRAQDAGCDVLLIDIDSPGGLKTESLEMARMIRDCKWAYTVVFVKHQAISGAALMSLGCDELHISPNAKFGDIGEIGIDAQEQFAWRLIEPKAESFLYRDARDLAESKGRPGDLAESMVDKDVLVYTRNANPDRIDDPADKNPQPNANAPVNGDDRVQQKGRFRLVRVDAKEKPEPPWLAIPETGAERFLTVSGQRAKQLEIAQAFAESRQEVIASFNGGQTSQVAVYRHTTTDTVVHILNWPLVTGLIIVIGLVALGMEMTAPGIGIGGLVAALCAGLFFWSRMLGGTGGWLEVVLFVAGIVFLLAELFVIPGFGVAGISGILLLVASVVLASQDFVLPTTAADWNQTLTTLIVVAISGFLFMIVAVIGVRNFGSLPVLNRLVLDAGQSSDPNATDSISEGGKKTGNVVHPDISVGDWGMAESVLRPSGRARFQGRSYDVVSDGGFIDAGRQVKVINIAGYVVTVTEAES